MPRISGGCLCGQIRYDCESEPVFTGICHCSHCQRQSGAAFSVVVAVPQAALTIEGATKIYTSTADSGRRVFNRFCADCGTTVVCEAEAFPGLIEIRAGTLDDTSWLKPTEEIYCDSAQPWVQLGGERQRFRKMPPLP